MTWFTCECGLTLLIPRGWSQFQCGTCEREWRASGHGVGYELLRWAPGLMQLR